MKGLIGRGRRWSHLTAGVDKGEPTASWVSDTYKTADRNDSINLYNNYLIYRSNLNTICPQLTPTRHFPQLRVSRKLTPVHLPTGTALLLSLLPLLAGPGKSLMGLHLPSTTFVFPTQMVLSTAHRDSANMFRTRISLARTKTF